jgi:PAS domain S-box-containing protein
MISNLRRLDGNAPGASAGSGFEGRILRLVKGGAERRAIEAGQIDAVMDPATGAALLLPEAQAALRADEARFRSLLVLTADWRWVQDEFYRFVSHTGIVSGESGIYDESAIGGTLRDPPFYGISETDWQAHRRQLDWRATFRDFELRCTDGAGEMRWVSVSGEPTFDAQDQFTGYRGTMRDITLRKWAETLEQKPIRLAGDTLDALAVEVCVLDSTGIVIMANRPSRSPATGRGSIGACVPVGANYLAVCDRAGGNERVDGAAIAAGIRQVIAGDSLLFRHEYACNSPRRRFNLTVTAFPGDGVARVVVSREIATRYLRAERIPGGGTARTRVSLNDKGAERKRQAGLLGLDHKMIEGGLAANSLLAALPSPDFRRLQAGLEPVTLTYGEVLYEPGDPIRHVYFPNDAVVSLLVTAEGREALEVGLVGREGMVGISLTLGMDVASVRALVQGTGTAMRMESARFYKEFQRCGPLQNELHRYSHAKLAQARQTAACNCFHVMEERLACWLLMTRDRVHSKDFPLTQEFLSHILGVRREGVTRAVGRLQKRKLIEYSRGRIRIVDQPGLEAASCSCYQVIRNLHF